MVCVLQSSDNLVIANFHTTFVWSQCISSITQTPTLKLFVCKRTNKYRIFLIQIQDNNVYVRPWCVAPIGSNATWSNVRPCDLWIVQQKEVV